MGNKGFFSHRGDGGRHRGHRVEFFFQKGANLFRELVAIFCQ